MCEINIQVLQPGGFVMYADRKCKIYKVKDDSLLIAVIVGMKKWVPIKDCQPCVK